MRLYLKDAESILWKVVTQRLADLVGCMVVWPPLYAK